MMSDNGQYHPEYQEAAEPENELAVDPQGIPILNEVIEPVDLEPALGAGPDQTDLPFSDFRPAETATPSLPDLETLRQQLREEFLGVIEQTASAVAERFRVDLERTLREELDRLLDEHLQQLLDQPSED